jgi:hypothetical protein
VSKTFEGGLKTDFLKEPITTAGFASRKKKKRNQSENQIRRVVRILRDALRERVEENRLAPLRAGSPSRSEPARRYGG